MVKKAVVALVFGLMLVALFFVPVALPAAAQFVKLESIVSTRWVSSPAQAHLADGPSTILFTQTDDEWGKPLIPTVQRITQTWLHGKVLDQGQTPTCVGYAWAGLEASQPFVQTIKKPVGPLTIYVDAQKIDQWPGEDYGGTSIEAAGLTLEIDGKISYYYLTYDYETIRRWMLVHGPVVLAVPWTVGQDYPEGKAGFVHPWGPIRAGHAFECYDIRGGSVGCINSWGNKWANHGLFRIERLDMEALLDRGGYAALPVPLGKHW